MQLLPGDFRQPFLMSFYGDCLQASSKIIFNWRAGAGYNESWMY